jgi:hypothetical protein
VFGNNTANSSSDKEEQTEAEQNEVESNPERMLPVKRMKKTWWVLMI